MFGGKWGGGEGRKVECVHFTVHIDVQFTGIDWGVMLAGFPDWIDQWKRQCRRTNSIAYHHLYRYAFVDGDLKLLCLSWHSETKIVSWKHDMQRVWTVDLFNASGCPDHGGSYAPCAAGRDITHW